MGFNYAQERKKFNLEWGRLRAEYKAAGMDERTISSLYAYDLAWFNSRRRFANRTQEIPDESIPDEPTGRSTLNRRFEAMSATFSESDFEDRFAWVETVETPGLAARLKKLPAEDLELLTLLVMDGYSQSELARKIKCNQSTIARKLSRIKKFLKNF